MQSHNNNRNFECSDCGLKFKYKHDLKKHSLEHSGKHRFNCKIFSKGLAFKSDLNTHMCSHREGKDFEFNDCDKTFKYKKTSDKALSNKSLRELKRHKKIMHGTERRSLKKELNMMGQGTVSDDSH
ncbi:hypothetical protein TNIN_224241 [Trichonephila inaurata madagascariensis]|uniref:C2H2-type domain-containing protein n=1 Tax=Trichonephila inaurata madagascariensis TaxID=2747483 RepID=A0A8X6M8R3_9ARAC|nr:hypothetical protein TNIN_224241 [Trichonephila inaurata madagascariensis]